METCLPNWPSSLKSKRELTQSVLIKLQDLMVSMLTSSKFVRRLLARKYPNTIQTVFKGGKLLSQVNTFVVLVPKNDNPLIIADYRLISLTNELYKIIIKIIANRMKPLMEKIINPSQSLVSRRSITDSILLSHDLLRGFHLSNGNPKTCLKLDISKAFDSIR